VSAAVVFLNIFWCSEVYFGLVFFWPPRGFFVELFCYCALLSETESLLSSSSKETPYPNSLNVLKVAEIGGKKKISIPYACLWDLTLLAAQFGSGRMAWEFRSW